MQNQSKRNKKLAKKKKQRKDFERRRNINKHPPSELQEFKKDIMAPAHDPNGEIKTDKKGNVIMQKVGTRIKTKRVKKTRKDKAGNDLPVIALPKSRKHRLSKAEIKKSSQAEKNAIQTVTGK